MEEKRNNSERENIFIRNNKVCTTNTMKTLHCLLSIYPQYILLLFTLTIILSIYIYQVVALPTKQLKTHGIFNQQEPKVLLSDWMLADLKIYFCQFLENLKSSFILVNNLEFIFISQM